jgi:hypothetical protein
MYKNNVIVLLKSNKLNNKLLHIIDLICIVCIVKGRNIVFDPSKKIKIPEIPDKEK